jgi:hypothetical protein
MGACNAAGWCFSFIHATCSVSSVHLAFRLPASCASFFFDEENGELSEQYLIGIPLLYPEVFLICTKPGDLGMGLLVIGKTKQQQQQKFERKQIKTLKTCIWHR